jgi:MYXO-CTERM domain-containing protein
VGNTVTPGASPLSIFPLSSGGAVFSHQLTGTGVQDGTPTAGCIIENSILAGSIFGTGATNLEYDAPTGTSTVDSASIIGGSPNLGALADNGGHTQTMLPNTGSPAIDSGDNAAANLPSRDQRGTTRIKNGTVDVGAAETGANEAPVITAPASALVGQSTPYTFGGTINIADDVAWGEALQLTLTATQGTVTLAQFTGLSFSAGDGTADAAMTFTGTLDAINAALNGAQFTPTTGYLGAATLQVDVNDQGNTGAGGALTDSATVAIDVQLANTAPVISAPANASTAPDVPRVFTNISIADADAGAGTLEVSLTCTNGTLTLAALTGLSFTVGDGTSDAAMTFTGTLTSINAALNGLTFTPTLAFVGAATIQIDADDQGNTGPGGALTDTHTINLNVAVPKKDGGDDDDEDCTTGGQRGHGWLLLAALALLFAVRRIQRRAT